MTFSNSIFAVEINGKAIIAFEARLHTLAEEIGHGWADFRAHEFSTKGSHGTDLPAKVKVRIARAEEKISYEAEAAAELFGEVKIVYLADPGATFFA
jgi:hypothetical protein